MEFLNQDGKSREDVSKGYEIFRKLPRGAKPVICGNKSIPNVDSSWLRLTEKGRQHYQDKRKKARRRARNKGRGAGDRRGERRPPRAMSGKCQRMMHRTVELFCVGFGRLFGFFFDRGFGGLKPDAAVRAIAKGLRD